LPFSATQNQKHFCHILYTFKGHERFSHGSYTPNQTQHGSNVIQAHRSAPNPNISMNEGSSERNWASNLDINAMREASIPAQTALQLAPIHLTPAPIGHKTATLILRRSAGRKSWPLSRRRRSNWKITLKRIADLPENRKPLPAALEFLRGLLLSKSFIDEVADAAVEKLLAEQAQAAEAIDSSASVECEVGSYLYFVEEPGGPIAYAHYDSNPRYCRALRVALNLGNRKTIAYLEKGEARTVAFFCAKAVARLVLRQQQNPFEAAILATLLTTIGRAPNARITEERFAVGLAQSVLLARLPDLPIYNNARLVAGRSFYLGKFKVFTPREDLGEAWKDNNKPRT
jgi:hypothetical protein